NTRVASLSVRYPSGDSCTITISAKSSKRSGTYSHQSPSSGSSAARPGGAGSPDGRIPHDRSRDPTHVDGSTARSSPPTESVPLHEPSCAKRVASSVTRLPVSNVCGCSSTAGNEPSQVRSNDSSSDSHTTRTRCNG